LRERTQRAGKVLRVDVAAHLLLGAVAPPDPVHVPVPVVIERAERAIERGGDIIGVDLLVVAPRTVLDDAAADEGVVGDLPVGRAVEVEARAERAERIERIGGVDRDPVEQVAVAGVGSDEQRQRRRLVRRVAAIVDPAQAEVDGFAQFLGEVDEPAIAFERDLNEVERGEVEAVGRHEWPIVGEDGRAPDHWRV